jgi:hypothetical protein
MESKPLLECFAKVEWAKAEIDKLIPRINALIATPRFNLPQPMSTRAGPVPWYPGLYPTGLHKSASHIDANGVEIWRFVAPDIPIDINVTVGSILHNLRSPLDQMLSTIALLKHASASQVEFPFGRTKDEFETALGKQKKLPPDAKAMIAALRPYRVRGNVLLYTIHALNRPDKHRPGLIPINLQTISRMERLELVSGAVLTIGPRTGLHLALDANGNFSQPNLSKAPAYITINGMRVLLFGLAVGKNEGRFIRMDGAGRDIAGKVPNRADWIAKSALPPGAPKDDMEIATAVPGTKFHANVQPSFNVALGDIEGFEREPVVAVLHKMRQLVEHILQRFEKRFFR